MTTEAPDQTIPHEDKVRSVIRDEMQGGRGAAQAAAITNASTTHALNSTFSDTEVEAALNALGTKINAILAALRTNETIDT